MCEDCTKCQVGSHNKVSVAVRCIYTGRVPTLFEYSAQLSDEWYQERNGDLTPKDVTMGSTRVVWWKHTARGGVEHVWQAAIYSRVTNGCPYCGNRKVGYGNDLKTVNPLLAEEWHPTKNEEGPERVLPGSHKKVWWSHVAKDGCLHEWEAAIYSRVISGCPYCNCKLAGYGNDLATKHPGLVEQWHKTKNSKKPEEYLPNSHVSVWWQHTTIDGQVHEWEAIIANRSDKNQKCPYCSSHRVGYGNDFKSCHPDLALEWHPIKNEFGPGHYMPQSNQKVWWQHLAKDGSMHEWFATISGRVGQKGRCGKGCPFCPDGSISKISGLWLNGLGVPDCYNKNREVVLGVGGYTFRVDGFDPSTNTVYEFLGNYWHGNPSMFSSDELNKTVGKTFGQLYQETMERIKLLEDVGYKVIYIWEKDFNKLVKDNMV